MNRERILSNGEGEVRDQAFEKERNNKIIGHLRKQI